MGRCPFRLGREGCARGNMMYMQYVFEGLSVVEVWRQCLTGTDRNRKHGLKLYLQFVLEGI